jgi:hypothetical protein
VIEEFFEAMKRRGWSAKLTLTDLEKIHIAIAFNPGTSEQPRGLKQGLKNNDGKYYKLVSAYYDIARSIPDDPGTSAGGDPGMNITDEAALCRAALAKRPHPIRIGSSRSTAFSRHRHSSSISVFAILA